MDPHSRIVIENADLRDKNEDLERLFALQHTRVRAAEAAWRNEHPGKENVLPDLGTLVEWLMKKAGLPLE